MDSRDPTWLGTLNDPAREKPVVAVVFVGLYILLFDESKKVVGNV